MAGLYTLGIDVGSSSVKVSALEVSSGKCAASCTAPSQEMPITAVDLKGVGAVGISYQMNGLVCLGAALAFRTMRCLGVTQTSKGL